MFEIQCREKGLGWKMEGLGVERLLVHGIEGILDIIGDVPCE